MNELKLLYIAQKITKQQKEGKVSSLFQLTKSCADFHSEDWYAVSSQCILAQSDR